jgi:hypothetical protein
MKTNKNLEWEFVPYSNNNGMMKNGGIMKMQGGGVKGTDYSKFENKDSFLYKDVEIPEGETYVDETGFVNSYSPGKVYTYRKGVWQDENGEPVQKVDKAQQKNNPSLGMKEALVYHRSIPTLRENSSVSPTLQNRDMDIMMLGDVNSWSKQVSSRSNFSNIDPTLTYTIGNNLPSNKPLSSLQNTNNQSSAFIPVVNNSAQTTTQQPPLNINQNTPVNTQSTFTGVNPNTQKDLSWVKPFTSKTKAGQTTPTGINLQSRPPQPTNWEGIASTWMDVNPNINSSIELQEEMYDYWLDKYQFGNPQEKSAATKQFKKLWGTFGDVKGNKPQGIAKNFKNWKPDDKTTYDDLARLRGNFMDSKLEARHLLPLNETSNFKSKQKTLPTDSEINLQSKLNQPINKTKSDFNMPQVLPLPFGNVYGEEAAARFEIPNEQVPFRRISPQAQLNEINRNTRAGLSLLGNTPTDVSNISNLLTQANTQGQQAINATNLTNTQNQMNVDSTNAQLNRQKALSQLQEDVRFTDNIARRKGVVQQQQLLDNNQSREDFADMLTEQRYMNFAEKIYPSNAWKDNNFNIYDRTKFTLTPKEEDKKKDGKKYGGKIKISKKSKKSLK